MLKEFVYRKYLRKSFRTFSCCLVYLLIFFIIFGVIYTLGADIGKESVKEYEFYYWINVVIIALGALLIYLLSYKIYFKKLKYSRVVLTDDEIMCITLNKEKIIRYEEITQIECAHFKLGIRWIKIKGKDNTIKLTVSIENIAILIKELKEKLDNKGLNNVYDSKDIYDFYKTATYSDDSWERIYELLKFIPPVLGVNVVISFIISFLIEDNNIKIIALMILVMFPILNLIFSEIILALKHLIEMKNEDYVIRMRDYQNEHRVFDAVFVILLIFISILIIYLVIKY